MSIKKSVSLPSFISKKLQRNVNSILFDFTSGSQELNEKILKLFLRLRNKRTMKYLIDLFKLYFSSFEVIQKTLSDFDKIIEKNSIHELKNYIKKKRNSYQNRINCLFKNLKRNIYPEIKILTISNSKTVFDVIYLLKLNQINPQVFVMKSNPGGEGKLLFRKLKQLNIKSYLIEDLKIVQFIKRIDVVIIGADSIYDKKWFVNKIGTRRLLELSKKFDKPVFVVALREKIIKRLRDPSISKRLRFDENLFEKVELNLVTELFVC